MTTYVCGLMIILAMIIQVSVCGIPFGCPSGFTPASNGTQCFKLSSNGSYTFNEALAYCQSQGAQLPVFHQHEQNMAASVFYQNKGWAAPFWLGYQQVSNNMYTTIDNSPLCYTNWMASNGGQFTPYNNSINCVQMIATTYTFQNSGPYSNQSVTGFTGQWIAKDCLSVARTLCQIQLNNYFVAAHYPTDSLAACPDAWMKVGPYCYMKQQSYINNNYSNTNQGQNAQDACAALTPPGRLPFFACAGEYYQFLSEWYLLKYVIGDTANYNILLPLTCLNTSSSASGTLICSAANARDYYWSFGNGTYIATSWVFWGTSLQNIAEPSGLNKTEFNVRISPNTAFRGHWEDWGVSGGVAYCQRLADYCPALALPAGLYTQTINGTIVGTSSLNDNNLRSQPVTTIVTFGCSNGVRIVSAIQCLATFQWNDSLPTCNQSTTTSITTISITTPLVPAITTTNATTTTAVTTTASIVPATSINTTATITVITNTTTSATTASKASEGQSESTTIAYPLNAAEKKAAIVFQTLGCTVLIGILAASILIFILLHDHSVERFLHMNQELSLLIGHVFILTLRDPSMINRNLCILSGICTQYFFLVSFLFMFLESIQFYVILTNVISANKFMKRLYFFFLGWGAPLLPTVITAAASYDKYISAFSCWTNFGHANSMGTILPAVVIFALVAITSESAHIKSYKKLPLVDQSQWIAAHINQKNMIFILAAQLGSWALGAVAIYYVKLYLYSAVFLFNIVLGVIIFVCHVMGNPKANAYVRDRWKRYAKKPKAKRSTLVKPLPPIKQ